MNSSFITVISATNGVSAFVCLVAAILVFTHKLHKKLVYRLALYQVLASLALATMNVVQSIFIFYTANPPAFARACIAVGLLTLYSEWTKLLFTMWVTFHLFCFAVLQKNFNKLEPLYVVTSLAVPGGMAAVPLITNTYGPEPRIGDCWIGVSNDTSHLADAALIETYALWDAPALAILIAASAAMAIVVTKLACLVRRRATPYEPLTGGRDTFWKALKQVLPLAIFPLMFCIFMIPSLVYDIFKYRASSSNESFALVTSTSFFLWGFASGVTLIVHIYAAKCCTQRHGLKFIQELPRLGPSVAVYHF